jgi:hypothetical protein
MWLPNHLKAYNIFINMLAGFKIVDVAALGRSDPDPDLVVETVDGQMFVLQRKESGISVFTGHIIDATQVPTQLQLQLQEQYVFHPTDCPSLLHFTVRPFYRMPFEEFETAITSFLSRVAFNQPLRLQDWDMSDKGWGKVDRVVLGALRTFGNSVAIATPHQALLCWLVYHDIKQSGVDTFSVDTFLRHDSKATRTIATALQHMQTDNIYTRLFADQINYRLSKVLGHTPRYLNNPPDIFDSESESE